MQGFFRHVFRGLDDKDCRELTAKDGLGDLDNVAAGLPEDLAYRGNDAGTVPAEKGDGQFFHVWSLRGYVLKTVNYASTKFKYDYFNIFPAERHPPAAEFPPARNLDDRA